MFWTYDHGNQQNPPFPKLHIELREQFEGSRTFTDCIEPLLPKKRTEQPWRPVTTVTTATIHQDVTTLPCCLPVQQYWCQRMLMISAQCCAPEALPKEIFPMVKDLTSKVKRDLFTYAVAVI